MSFLVRPSRRLRQVCLKLLCVLCSGPLQLTLQVTLGLVCGECGGVSVVLSMCLILGVLMLLLRLRTSSCRIRPCSLCRPFGYLRRCSWPPVVSAKCWHGNRLWAVKKLVKRLMSLGRLLSCLCSGGIMTGSMSSRKQRLRWKCLVWILGLRLLVAVVIMCRLSGTGVVLFLCAQSLALSVIVS